MKSAIGGSMLFYLVIFFVITVILLFASILSYSKAYRVKNRIINILETEDLSNTSTVQSQIDSDLKLIGYKTTSKTVNCNSESKTGTCDSAGFTQSTYKYCICRHTTGGNGVYYEVITYNQFEFPLIGSIFASRVRGETKILGRVYE